jgi:SAM-dependent methyltransferase
LLRAIIRASRGSSRFGPFVTPHQHGGGDAAAAFELAAVDELWSLFAGLASPDDVRGRRVLDLGCGYGGKTMHYAAIGAAEVTGVEPDEAVVEQCRAIANARGSRATFVAASAERLPFAARSFDTVICWDVLEHVVDPGRALEEAKRVTAPGGIGLFILPTYRGARAGHLDPVTRVPLLHRVFSPDVVARVVFDEPRASVSALGCAVPTRSLNGITRRDLLRLVDAAGWSIEVEVLTPIVTRESTLRLGALTARALSRLRNLPEVLIAHVCLRLRC